MKYSSFFLINFLLLYSFSLLILFSPKIKWHRVSNSTVFRPAVSLGPVGMTPWNNVLGFLDRSASWIGNSPMARTRLPHGIIGYFVYQYENCGDPIQATLDIICDSVCDITLNGDSVGKQTRGWGSKLRRSKSNPGGFFQVTLRSGLNTLIFQLYNEQNNSPSAILATVVHRSNKTPIFSTGRPGWMFSRTPPVLPIAPLKAASCQTPIRMPTTPPSQNSNPPQKNRPFFLCPAFSVTKARYNDIRHYIPCSFQVCGGSSININNCPNENSSTRCRGDTNIILKTSQGAVLSKNDDGCTGLEGGIQGLCSSLSHRFANGPCATYTLWQGCYDNEPCNGRFMVTSLSGVVRGPRVTPRVRTSSPTSSRRNNVNDGTTTPTTTTANLDGNSFEPTPTAVISPPSINNPNGNLLSSRKPSTQIIPFRRTFHPSFEPSNEPSMAPTAEVTSEPSPSPSTSWPSYQPSVEPSNVPTMEPTPQPTPQPSLPEYYNYIATTSYRSNQCGGGAISGNIAGETLFECFPSGQNMQMKLCDQVSGDIIINTFPANSNCQGATINSYRVPTGCMPIESGIASMGNSTLQTCSINVMGSSPFHKFGAGVATIISPDSSTCSLSQSKDASWNIRLSKSWTYQPLNTCIITDGKSPTMFTACSNADRTVTVNTYQNASDCSGTPSSTNTVMLFDCLAESDGYSAEVCFNQEGRSIINKQH